MPSRSTILTGQYPSTHGVWMNGVPLPTTAPSVASVLNQAGYRTALIGKAHFQPFLDPFLRFEENAMSRGSGSFLPDLYRGFEHMESAAHGTVGPFHYARWLRENHPEVIGGFYSVLNSSFDVNSEGDGDTGAPQVHVNPVPRELYHTDWVAERTISWLDSLGDKEDWFCWMSFPDPHHPWDPPQSEVSRVNWRDVPLPEGYIESKSQREAILDDKPRHWRAWYDGSLISNYEAPSSWVPATLTADQVREINARNAVECELIDEAIGRVIASLIKKGCFDDVDVIFTTDHGELQGDFGLLFKGPYHVDGLLRLPLIWRPAPSAGIRPSTVTKPVGLLDLAPTFCQIAGVSTQPWMEGKPLPITEEDAINRDFSCVLTEWDSELFGVSVHLRTIMADRWICTTYQPGTSHDGSEGELYDIVHDPLQRHNLWNDPSLASIRDGLVDRIWESLPRHPGKRRFLQAPV